MDYDDTLKPLFILPILRWSIKTHPAKIAEPICEDDDDDDEEVGDNNATELDYAGLILFYFSPDFSMKRKEIKKEPPKISPATANLHEIFIDWLSFFFVRWKVKCSKIFIMRRDGACAVEFELSGFFLQTEKGVRREKNILSRKWNYSLFTRAKFAWLFREWKGSLRGKLCHRCWRLWEGLVVCRQILVSYAFAEFVQNLTSSWSCAFTEKKR